MLLYRIPSSSSPSGYFKQDSTGKYLDSLGVSTGGQISLFQCHQSGGNQVREGGGPDVMEGVTGYELMLLEYVTGLLGNRCANTWK